MRADGFASQRRRLQAVLRCAVAVVALAAWPAKAEAPADRYTVSAVQGLVTDLRTGLVWQQTPNTTLYTWTAAATYCRSLTVGLTGGFRVPSFKELLTLIDPVRSRPAVDLKAFPNTPGEWFWTASNRNPMGPAAVSFDTGETSFFAPTASLRVRCVR